MRMGCFAHIHEANGVIDRMKKVIEIADALEYLISDDNTETQFDYVEEIQGAIAMLRQIPKCMQDCAYIGSCSGVKFSDCIDKNRRAGT